MNWEPLATRDPVPGDPGTVREVGRDYKAAATNLTSAMTSLDKIKSDDQHSKTVAKLVESAGEERQSLDAVATRYREVGEALKVYATALAHAQSEAEKLRIKAMTAQQSRDSANTELAAAKKALEAAELAESTDGTPVSWPVRNRVTTAMAAAKEHGNTIATAQADLVLVVRAWRAAANTAASVITTTVKQSPLNDKWYQKPWLVKIAAVVSKVADYVATIAGVLALITAWIPVIGQVIAAIALVATVVSLVSKLVLAMAGEIGIGDLLIEAAILVLSIVGARFAGKFAQAYAGKLGAAAKARAGRVKGTYNKTKPAARTHTRAVYDASRAKAPSTYRAPWKIAQADPHGKWAKEHANQFSRGWREGLDSFNGLSAPEKALRALGIGDDAIQAMRHVRHSEVEVLKNKGIKNTLLSADSELVNMMSNDGTFVKTIVIGGAVKAQETYDATKGVLELTR